MLDNFIDAHVHLNKRSTAIIELAKKWNAKFLSINVDIPFFESIEEQEAVIHQLQKEYPQGINYITSFDTQFWNTDKWLPHALQQIKNGLANGAAGVKIWKNIGMDASVHDIDGNFVMVDNPRFDPIYEYLAENHILLLGHQGEPRNCWLPVEEMTVDSDREYFLNHPEYHMFKNPEYPSYEAQIEARDNVLLKHPDLKYVGLHLFSMEYSLDEVAKRLEKFPNSKIDLAERICHIQLQAMKNPEKVREFFTKYQDRIIYGTDVIDDGSMNDQELTAHFEDLWKAHWNFFSTADDLSVPEFQGRFRGLDLPKEVLAKIFRDNAIETYGFLT